jgi:hypothetical protein
MTGKERETIARALGRGIADAPIRGTSVELTDRDVKNIRDQLVESIAAGPLGELLQVDVAQLDLYVDVARMT